jgi:hypothetical protein
MSTYDDDRIEFDFFDEPETEEAPRTRRRPRRGGGGGPRRNRPPMKPPTGIVPLARLVGLIAIAIVIVVAFVFWVGACQGKSKHDEYASYAASVHTIAASSNALGRAFQTKFTSTSKQSDFEALLQQNAQQEQQEYDQAQQIRPPGPLRAIHQRLVDALELRAKGFAALGSALALWNPKNAASTSSTTEALATQGALLAASDVDWEQLYRIPATQELKTLGVTGVVIPKSAIVPTTDLVSARYFQLLLSRLTGASTGGTPGGKHGDALVSVVANPGGTALSTSTATTIKVSANLSFVATVEDSGSSQETGVVVHLTITAGSSTIKRNQTIQLIQPGQQQTVTFGNFNLPTAAFGNKATVRVDVAQVPGETNASNNTATYTVFFTLS